MKYWLFSLRIMLTALAAGLVAVYVWQSVSLALWGPPIDLPEASSANVLEVTVPLEEKPDRLKYLCDEFTEETERANCLDQVIFEDRDKSLYDDGGRQGCGRVQQVANPSDCERSMEKTRHFVWEHWKKRKRGHLAVVKAFDEREWVIHLFIEPGDAVGWRIVERSVPMLRKPEDPEHYWLGDLIDIKWKRATAEEERYGLKPGTLYLELSNVAGDGLVL